MQARAVSGSSTVPAPTTASAPNLFARSSMRRTAPGTVIVISRTGTPPSRMASMARAASSADSARTTGTIPTSRIVARVFFLAHRCTRAVPPFITRSTSARVAIVVSPGVVMARAPWAAPHSTANCAPLPASKP